MPVATIDLLDPSLLPQDQGWSVVNALNSAGNFDPARPIDATADGSHVTINSIGLDDPTAFPGTLQWFYQDIPVLTDLAYSLEFEIRIDDIVTAPPRNEYAGAAIYGATRDPSEGGLVDGFPRDQLIYFTEDEIGWGDRSQSYALDTTDGFHTYRLEIAPDGVAQVFVDGSLALERDDFEAMDYLGFGDVSFRRSQDSAMWIADITVSGTTGPEPETTTYIFVGTVENTSFEPLSPYEVASFYGLMDGDVAAFSLEIENQLLQPGQPTNLAWNDPGFSFDVRLETRQHGHLVTPIPGLVVEPDADLSRMVDLEARVGDRIDGPFIDLYEDVVRVYVDGDVSVRLDGSWIANQPGNPGLPETAGGSLDDSLSGSDGDEFLLGLGGDDQIRGHGGDDVLDGGAGDDNLYGKAGDDTLFGQAGQDSMRGAEGADTLFGGDAADFMRGGDDNDLLFGEDGDDAMEGDAGDDMLNGGLGADSLRGETGDDTLIGFDGDDWLKGGSGDDVLAGGLGDDTAYGNDGVDQLNGGVGDDMLFGGSGDDTLFGGAGNDLLDGDPGDDLLVITYGDGHDVIDGFQAGAGSEDVIDLSALFRYQVGSLADVLANATYDGSATTITLSTTDPGTLTLLGIAPGELHEDDFVFRV